ncbi:MAG: hypothetical protein EBS01_11255 [Verrucomicrobia bacterium]|nr:hypothetical protein [Verrucomicrobiota bacterium]
MKNTLLSILLLTTFSLQPELHADNSLSLWYQQPATNWQAEALPIGNGHLGAMIFGGMQKAQLPDQACQGGAYPSFKGFSSDGVGTGGRCKRCQKPFTVGGARLRPCGGSLKTMALPRASIGK